MHCSTMKYGVAERPRRTQDLLLLLIGIAALAYAVYRAVTMSFTHDESFSFIHYVSSSTGDLLQLKDAYTNNHVLNSIGMKWSSWLFGPSEWALRLPNLLALTVYLFYAGLLVRRMHPVVAIGGYLLLSLNGILLGVFAMARGYGLSMGFMLMATHHLVRSIGSASRRHIVLFHLACILAVLSNFTMLDYYAAALGIYYPVLLLIRPAATDRWKAWSDTWHWHALMLVVAISVLALPVSRVLAGNAFDFGGKTTFIDSTLRWVIYSATPGYSITDPMLPSLYAIILALAGLALAASVYSIVRNLRGVPGFSHPGIIICTFLPVVVCTLTILQHWIFGTDYLEARFALFLLPLFHLLAVHLVQWSVQHFWKWGGLTLFALLSIASFHGSASSAFPLRSSEWQYDVRTDDAIDLLIADHGGSPDTVRIGNSWALEPTINFYRIQRGAHWLLPATRDELTPEDDYRLLLEDGLLPDDTVGFVRIARFPEAGTLLLKRDIPVDG